MKRELTEERESADERLVKKIRLDPKPTFRKRGHEKQFTFNEQLREKFDAVSSAIGQTPLDVEKARTAIKEGEKLIDARQKVIKIADRSEHGWATVAEYEEHELADNSDDEKRLFRAEARAGRKLKQRGFNNARGKGGARKPFRASPATTGGEHTASQSTSTFAPHRNSLQSLLAHLSASKPTGSYGMPGTSQLGPCYLCGKLGHYRKACPLLSSTTPK